MINSIVATIFSNQNTSDKLDLTEDFRSLIELITLQIQISLLQVAQKVLDSMKAARRENARRFAEDCRAGDRCYAKRKAEHLFICRKEMDLYPFHFKN